MGINSGRNATASVFS